MVLYKNNNSFNKISICHFPGNDTTQYDFICNYIKDIKFTVDPRFSIIVIANKIFLENSNLIYQLKNNNINYIISNTAYNIDSKNWSNPDKIKYIIEALNKCTTEYVFILDTRDVLITNNLDDSYIDMLKSYNKKIIYNANKETFPKLLFNNESYTNDKVEFKYLNAGVCFGYTEFLKNFYSYCSRNLQVFPYNKSEQLIIRYNININNNFK